MSTFEAEPIDYRHTARRPTWADLPDLVTAAVRAAVGDITHVDLAGGGFTPAFAATITAAHADRYFIKAADAATEFGQANQREAAVLAALPTGLPVPRRLWSTSVGGWSLLCLEMIDGHMPGQPWTSTDLHAVLSAHAVIADALAAPSPQLRAAVNEVSFAEQSDQYLDAWRRIDLSQEPAPDVPWLLPHIAELAELERLLPAATNAEGVMHYDLRPDNTLITAGDATAVILDWNWARHGPAWVDTIMLLKTAAGHHDVETLLASHPTTANVDPQLIDAVLAAIGGSLARAGTRPELAASPMLRAHQRNQDRQALTWLAQRRGWISR